jgi:hypothetical protein
LHAEVLAGKLSAHRAMIEAGFRKKPSNLELCMKYMMRLSEEELAEVARFIGSR